MLASTTNLKLEGHMPQPEGLDLIVNEEKTSTDMFGILPFNPHGLGHLLCRQDKMLSSLWQHGGIQKLGEPLWEPSGILWSKLESSRVLILCYML